VGKLQVEIRDRHNSVTMFSFVVVSTAPETLQQGKTSQSIDTVQRTQTQCEKVQKENQRFQKGSGKEWGRKGKKRLRQLLANLHQPTCSPPRAGIISNLVTKVSLVQLVDSDPRSPAWARKLMYPVPVPLPPVEPGERRELVEKERFQIV